MAYPGYHQRRTGCLGAGNRYLYIDPKGDIQPCPFCRGAAGNAITGSLEDAISALKRKGCHEFRSNSAADFLLHTIPTRIFTIFIQPKGSFKKNPEKINKKSIGDT